MQHLKKKERESNARSLSACQKTEPGHAWYYICILGKLPMIMGSSVFQHGMETRSKARRLCKYSPQTARETLTLTLIHLNLFSFSQVFHILLWN